MLKALYTTATQKTARRYPFHGGKDLRAVSRLTIPFGRLFRFFSTPPFKAQTPAC